MNLTSRNRSAVTGKETGKKVVLSFEAADTQLSESGIITERAAASSSSGF